MTPSTSIRLVTPALDPAGTSCRDGNVAPRRRAVAPVRTGIRVPGKPLESYCELHAANQPASMRPSRAGFPLRSLRSFRRMIRERGPTGHDLNTGCRGGCRPGRMGGGRSPDCRARGRLRSANRRLLRPLRAAETSGQAPGQARFPRLLRRSLYPGMQHAEPARQDPLPHQVEGRLLRTRDSRRVCHPGNLRFATQGDAQVRRGRFDPPRGTVCANCPAPRRARDHQSAIAILIRRPFSDQKTGRCSIGSSGRLCFFANRRGPHFPPRGCELGLG
jgi:hypothetical protein